MADDNRDDGGGGSGYDYMMNVGTMLKVHMYFLRRFCERSSAQVSWFFRGTSWSVVIVGLVPDKAMDPDTPTSSAFASYGIQLAE
ncbi:hypothetical protein HanHA89_Chr11g0445801 [Helianthus annuus]|nr:hypothetical protein HanHA89_Chr11g0445801 [Helianthus annuus]